ncbi:MAG: TIGR04552 family protein [Bdellovibrionales bacterium]|nr:TIGR04552 family protein [Bdellovibrionales bacterium]
MAQPPKHTAAGLLRRKYDFRWDVLDAIMGGRSLIDSNTGLTGFPMENIDDADRFTRSYGMDWADPIERAELLGNFHEALSFIRKNFLKPEAPEGLSLEVPRKIVELQDMRELLLLAANKHPMQRDAQSPALMHWACALLKVIHTIAHIDKDLRQAYLPEVQKQILDRFYKVVHRDGHDELYLGSGPDDPMRIDLVAFETKSRKSRESVLLKLLHKKENVAENIFDQVGIRFVTRSLVDCVRLVKYLKDEMILMPATVMPSRSRNTLVSIEEMRARLGEIAPKLEAGTVDEPSLLDALRALPSANPDGVNPHSSEYYRAIQFTGRQLIKLKNPMYDPLRELKSLAKSQPLPEQVQAHIDAIDLQYLRRESRFFYPYEVQIMDSAAAEQNEKGLSAHSEYKKSQTQTAMRRVMGSLMDAGRG